MGFGYSRHAYGRGDGVADHGAPQVDVLGDPAHEHLPGTCDFQALRRSSVKRREEQRANVLVFVQVRRGGEMGGLRGARTELRYDRTASM
jgi:hypothetical protein